MEWDDEIGPQCNLCETTKNPIESMYGIFTYIWLIFMVNVGKYTIHGFYGNVWVCYDLLLQYLDPSH